MYQRKYRTSDHGREYFRRYEQEHKTRRGEMRKVRNYNQRLEVLSYYSSGTPKCACCGDLTYEFLTIDHTNGGGNKHRKSLGNRGSCMTMWLKKNKFPEGFSVLCMNCNWAKGKYGSCPHVKSFNVV